MSAVEHYIQLMQAKDIDLAAWRGVWAADTSDILPTTGTVKVSRAFAEAVERLETNQRLAFMKRLDRHLIRGLGIPNTGWRRALDDFEMLSYFDDEAIQSFMKQDDSGAFAELFKAGLDDLDRVLSKRDSAGQLTNWRIRVDNSNSARDYLELTLRNVQAQADTSKVDMRAAEKTELERREARGRWSAYQATANAIAAQIEKGFDEPSIDERRADIRQRTEILTRSNKLRENCLKIARMYRETLDIIQATIGKMPPQVQPIAYEKLGPAIAFLGASYPTLAGVALAIKPEELEKADELVANLEAACTGLKEAAVKFWGGGTLQ